MDIKSDLDKYKDATGVKSKKEDILQSINILKKSKIQHEFRITVVPKLVRRTELKKISKLVGNSKVVLQQFENDKELMNKNFKKLRPYPSNKLKEFKELFSKAEVRAS